MAEIDTHDIDPNALTLAMLHDPATFDQAGKYYPVQGDSRLLKVEPIDTDAATAVAVVGSRRQTETHS